MRQRRQPPTTDELDERVAGREREWRTALRSYRIERGLSQSQLGALLNRDQSYVSRVERNGTPLTLDAMLRIIAVLCEDATMVLPDPPRSLAVAILRRR